MSDYFIFDDIDTRNYEGVYVYFDEVDFTPKRVGEFIEIPSRNGEFFLDGGRYEDVTHTYDVIALNKEVGRNLINAVASKVGHHRLEDSFNPDEYYSAVFAAEVEPTVTLERDKITFKLMFTRKPQRFLTSGETASTVANNGTLTNPTLFESRPMLEVKGYGTIGFNGYEIEIDNAVIGEIELISAKQSYVGPDDYVVQAAQKSLYNAGDTLTIQNSVWGFSINSHSNVPSIVNATASDSNALFKTVFVNTYPVYQHNFKTTVSPLAFTAGTDSTITDTVTITATMEDSSTKTFTWTWNVSYSVETYGGKSTIYIGRTKTFPTGYYDLTTTSSNGALVVDSTISILGDPTYIDCDLGEAYMIKDDVPVSLDAHIDLGSDLPKLAVGSNEFTYDNTITDLKVIPRWWKV